MGRDGQDCIRYDIGRSFLGNGVLVQSCHIPAEKNAVLGTVGSVFLRHGKRIERGTVFERILPDRIYRTEIGSNKEVQPSNADAPMDFTESGKVMEASEVQPLKAD